MLQNLYYINGSKVPTITMIQTAIADYGQIINPNDPSNPTASQVGITDGISFDTLSNADNALLFLYGYTVTSVPFDPNNPSSLTTLTNQYHAIGLSVKYTLPQGGQVDHAVTYDGANMYTSAPTTQSGNSSSFPMTPADMAARATTNQALILIPSK
jgi:hypothetical protein